MLTQSKPIAAVGLLKLMRPRQWIKNAFVLAPVVFAREFTDPAAVANALIAFVLFCVASSAGYILNDIHDIERDRSHPSILSWESNNGTMDETIGKALLAINQMWDPINTRVAADRTPDPVNGYVLGCTLEGCEVGIKNQFPNNPAWGSEYWGNGTARGLAYDYELAFAAPFINSAGVKTARTHNIARKRGPIVSTVASSAARASGTPRARCV